MSLDQRSVSRDTLQLKRRLDDVLYRLAEQAQSIKDGTEGVTIDALVDDAAKDITIPVAHYVRKIIRRYGIGLDTILASIAPDSGPTDTDDDLSNGD